ncbi:MAG: hypothetical protein Q8L34_04450 [Candidatus Woesearchaeota archaeon]|nr:hypothetical protein [Candidatus Woesearchaeota archaeon]
MTKLQRINSDMATLDKREIADKTIKENRIRNDDLTKERRSKTDKTLDESRLRNDEMTANRREIKDGHDNMRLAMFILAIAVVVFGAYVIFV